MTERMLHGVFKATDRGSENINPIAWSRNKHNARFSPFPAQIPFRVVYDFKPLPESSFRHMFHDGNRIRRLDEKETKEILTLYKLWQKLGGNYYEEPKIVLSNKITSSIPSLSINPWSDRICFVFSSERDPLSGLCSLDFDDLLKMVSTFHFRTPIEIKHYWTFKLYDFDNDGLIGKTDVHQCVRRIVGPTMSDREIKEIVHRVFAETDLDGDETLTIGEFAAVMRRFQFGFARKFSIKI